MIKDSSESNRLKRYHESVGRARQARSPEALGEIAIHYDQAGLKPQAFDFALRAADQALAGYGYEDAVDLLAVAERNAADVAGRAEVRIRLAQIAEATGRYELAAQHCDAADEWCTSKAPAERRIATHRLRERIKDLLGQPATQTLETATRLLKDAEKEGCGSECISLLIMTSQAKARLGDLAGAREAAEDAVKRAEAIRNRPLLGTALNRLGLTQRPTDPDRAVASWRRALEIFRDLGDDRGAAGAHNNLGIYYSDRGEWQTAERHLDEATRLARKAGVRADLGAATLNLGVAVLKTGDYDRAHGHLGESLALFAAIKNSERQLYSLYNMAHLERERGQLDVATDLYEFAAQLAHRIGQSDVEIGALAGAGLCRLGLGRGEEASSANKQASDQLAKRSDWFQGRELAEALRIRLAAQKGKVDEALGQFETALALAESSDFYCAAWLTAECGKDLLSKGGTKVRTSVSRLADRAQQYGLAEISRKYDQLLAQA